MLFQWSLLDQCLIGVDLREDGVRGNIDSSFREFCCRGEQKSGTVSRGEQKSGTVSRGVEKLRTNSMRNSHNVFVC